MKAIKVNDTELTGRFLGSLVRRRLTSVAPAIIAAKGKVVANPQPWVWRFMTLIHTHINAPTYGFLKMYGREPKTISVTRMSLMNKFRPANS